MKYDKHYFAELEHAQPTEVPRNTRIVELVERFVPDKGTVLDVGMGTGLLMHIAQQRGWQVSGTDISAYTVKSLKKHFSVYLGQLSELDLPKNKFDAIIMRQSIEHMADPVAELSAAKRLLKKGGVICITTPNSHGIHAKLYGSDWPHWSHPYHLHFFSKDFLKSLVLRVGFSVVYLGTEELTIFDLIKFQLAKIIPINYKRTSLISRWFDQLVAKMGLGEGLVIVGRK